jgi:hypothetical protein
MHDQTVALRGLAAGLASVGFLAPQLEADTNRGSRYSRCYRPEDGDDEKHLCFILGDDATRARRDHHGRHTGDEDANRNTSE